MMAPFMEKICEFEELKMDSSRKRRHLSTERDASSDGRCHKRRRSVSSSESFDCDQRNRSVSSRECSRSRRNVSFSSRDAGYDSSDHDSRVRRHRSYRRNKSCHWARRGDSTDKSTSNHEDASCRAVRRRRRWKSSVRPAARPRDDENGHLIYTIGDVLHMRYELGQLLGEGTFGKVIECRDLKNNGDRVALKIVRKIDRYYESAKLEVDVLQKLNQLDPQHTSGCIHMLDWFDFDGHICIVFSMLGASVFEFQRRNRNQPFSLDHIRHIAKQLCQAVNFCHEKKLTHTDLKPENILFVDSAYNYTTPPHNANTPRRPELYRRVKCADVKLIDFGSATFENEHHTRIISTPHYRAPEVILELGWSYPSDVWSIGCILLELYTGRTIFSTEDTIEHLAMMEVVLGAFPSSMAHKTRKRYFKHGRLVRDSRGRRWNSLQSCRRLESLMVSRSSSERQLFDLVRHMLEYRPDRRITLADALRHPFLADPRADHRRHGHPRNSKRSDDRRLLRPSSDTLRHPVSTGSSEAHSRRSKRLEPSSRSKRSCHRIY